MLVKQVVKQVLLLSIQNLYMRHIQGKSREDKNRIKAIDNYKCQTFLLVPYLMQLAA
jgi:hypothetical protein